MDRTTSNDHTSSNPTDEDRQSQARREAPQTGHPGRTRSITAVLGALIISAGVFVTWVVTANNVMGFGVYQNSTVARIDQIEQNYVKNATHQSVVSELNLVRGRATELQSKLAASEVQVAHLLELLNGERQNSQARAVACQSLNSRVMEAKNEQQQLENSIARRYRTNGIFQAPSKDIPLETALESDRRYSTMLQEQILEMTREMRTTCGYLPMTQSMGQPG